MKTKISTTPHTTRKKICVSLFAVKLFFICFPTLCPSDRDSDRNMKAKKHFAVLCIYLSFFLLSSKLVIEDKPNLYMHFLRPFETLYTDPIFIDINKLYCMFFGYFFSVGCIPFLCHPSRNTGRINSVFMNVIIILY